MIVPSSMTHLRESAKLDPPASADSTSQLRIEDLPNLSPEEYSLLSRHFEAFTETTNKLVTAHQYLQQQVCSLLEELERKNEELEKVNQELAHRMDEMDRVRRFTDSVIDSMLSGLIVLDGSGALKRMNRSARRLLGLEEGPLTGGIKSLLAEGMKNPLAGFFESGERSRSGETRLRKHEAGTFLVRYTAVPIAENSEAEPRDEGILLMFEDLSQVRLLEEKARRSDRLVGLEELATGVAHEMRNPLATMRGFLQLLPTEFEDPQFREECSTRLIREIDRLARLTDDLRELSRPIQPQQCETDLEDLIQEVVGEQQEILVENGIELAIDLEPLPLLHLDRDRIKQVLLNLVINARQAMPAGGRLDISMQGCKEKWEGDSDRKSLVRLSICDNGQGIENQNLDRIFDPFFTTKGQGTGLGLSLCHRIIEEHDGVIRVESSPGQGTKFDLFFPLPETSPEQVG